MQAHLVEAVEEFINTGAAPAERMIRDLVACEVSHINTDHPQFIGGSRAIAVVMERRQQVGPPSAYIAGPGCCSLSQNAFEQTA